MVNAEDEDAAAADESDASDDEEPMETDTKTAPDAPMEVDNHDEEKDGVTLNVATTEAIGTAALKAAAMASGLPQSKEELESLISTIHQTVNDSVLPRLHKCLTAKVQCATHTYGRVSSLEAVV